MLLSVQNQIHFLADEQVHQSGRGTPLTVDSQTILMNADDNPAYPCCTSSIDGIGHPIVIGPALVVLILREHSWRYKDEASQWGTRRIIKVVLLGIRP